MLLRDQALVTPTFVQPSEPCPGQEVARNPRRGNAGHASIRLNCPVPHGITAAVRHWWRRWQHVAVRNPARCRPNDSKPKAAQIIDHVEHGRARIAADPCQSITTGRVARLPPHIQDHGCAWRTASIGQLDQPPAAAPPSRQSDFQSGRLAVTPGQAPCLFHRVMRILAGRRRARSRRRGDGLSWYNCNEERGYAHVRYLSASEGNEKCVWARHGSEFHAVSPRLCRGWPHWFAQRRLATANRLEPEAMKRAAGTHQHPGNPQHGQRPESSSPGDHGASEVARGLFAWGPYPTRAGEISGSSPERTEPTPLLNHETSDHLLSLVEAKMRVEPTP